MNVEYKQIKVKDLTEFHIRDIRPAVVDDIKERIAKGYNPARPLTVVPDGDTMTVADGNHRLEALIGLGIEDVPCVIHNDGDAYALAFAGNADEDSYSPMDVFDFIESISKMREDGLTQSSIGERIGWSREGVKHYAKLMESIGTELLATCKAHQKGRVPENGTTVPLYNFTENWFRNSGLYKLAGRGVYDVSQDAEDKSLIMEDEDGNKLDTGARYQSQMVEAFIGDKFRWNGNKVKSEAAKYDQWLTFIGIAISELADTSSHLYPMVSMIENGQFRTEDQLRAKIKAFNSEAENKLICGDCVQVMESLDDGSIDVVISDVPYGIDYTSNHSLYNEYVTKTGIDNDSDLDETLSVIDSALEVLSRKTKENAHVYLFTSWKVYPQFVAVVSKHFDVKNMIVWNKGNASMGDLTGAWGNMHELIVFATKGRRALNTRKFDVLEVPRVPTTKAIHPTQKPEALITHLLDASAQEKDVVIDPFMGSGSTIKAIKDHKLDMSYIGIELDEEKFQKAKTYIGG